MSDLNLTDEQQKSLRTLVAVMDTTAREARYAEYVLGLALGAGGDGKTSSVRNARERATTARARYDAAYRNLWAAVGGRA